MNRGLLGTKSGDKGEKNKSGPIYVTFIFLLSDTFISAGVSTHGNGRRGQITQAICLKEQKL